MGWLWKKSRNRLGQGGQTRVERWDAMARDEPALAQAAATLLEAFLNGAKPPALRSRRVIDDLLDQPSRGLALRWLMENGLVAEHVVPASLPMVTVGQHGYGHPGFNGYHVTPEAREVVRHLFGAEVWTAE